jgi:hypothetical protein
MTDSVENVLVIAVQVCDGEARDVRFVEMMMFTDLKKMFLDFRHLPIYCVCHSKSRSIL